MPIFGGIFVGRRFGAFDSTPAGGRVDDAVGPGFPPAGSYNSTLYGVDYPVAQGGSAVQDPAANLYPSQICDVHVLNDGSGGTYIDWVSSVTNIQYKAYGTSYYTDPSPTNSGVEVPSGGGVYFTAGSAYADYRHDGSGGYFQDWVNQTWFPNGTDNNIELLAESDQQTEVPSGSSNYYSNGRFNGYTWDGSGGYNYPVTKGTYYSNGTDTNLTGLDVLSETEVPSGSAIYWQNGQNVGYTWDGSGGYNYPVTKATYYANGSDTNIESLNGGNQSTEVPSGSGNYYDNGLFNGYTWDGSGGYNFPVTKGAYYSNGTDTNLAHLDSTHQTEVPSGSMNYYNNGLFDGYTWDGNGGYNYPVTKGAYYSSGTVIFHYDNTVEVPSGSGQNFSNGTFQEYQWDGSGGYNDTSGGSYYSYGTYITNYAGTDYYWDGNGGYYS